MAARADPPRECLSMCNAAARHEGRVGDIRIMTFVPPGILRYLDQSLTERFDTAIGRAEVQASADDGSRDLNGLDDSSTLPRPEHREIARGLCDFVGRRRAGDVRHAGGRDRGQAGLL